MRKVNDVNIAKRSGIISPIKESNPDTPSCVICNKNSFNATGVCCLCDRFICFNHTICIDKTKYCTICKDNDSYKPLISAVSQHIELQEKKCCIIS